MQIYHSSQKSSSVEVGAAEATEVMKVDDADLMVEVAAKVLEAATDKDEEVEMAPEVDTVLEESAEVVMTLEVAGVETALETTTEEEEVVLEVVAEAVEEVATSEAELFSIQVSHRIVVHGCVALTKEQQQHRSMLTCGPSCC